VVVDYNTGKSSIDLADQMASYSNPLRRSLKWYRKVAMDLILNISVVNASILFKKVRQKVGQKVLFIAIYLQGTYSFHLLNHNFKPCLYYFYPTTLL